MRIIAIAWALLIFQVQPAHAHHYNSNVGLHCYEKRYELVPYLQELKETLINHGQVPHFRRLNKKERWQFLKSYNSQSPPTAHVWETIYVITTPASSQSLLVFIVADCVWSQAFVPTAFLNRIFEKDKAL